MGIAVLLLRRLGITGGAVATLLGAGCVSSDLSANASITGEVIECLPPRTPGPSAVERAIWFPNASGFGTTDASPLGHVTGVLVLAGDHLWFMAWNAPERHFDMLKVIAFLPAVKVSVERLGTSSMLVIRSRNDSFDSFELMTGGALGSDPKATQDLWDKLQFLRSKNPQLDP